MIVLTDNINLKIANYYLPGKKNIEALLFAELLTQMQINEHVYSIEFYRTAPQKLGITKDAYRRAMAKIKKSGLIYKKGLTIALTKEQIKKVNHLTFKQI